VYKALHDLLHVYLAEDCQLVSVTGRRQLHSWDSACCSEPTHVLAIAHSLLLDLAYGTVCQPSCESRILHSDNFDKHSKRIYLVSDSWSADRRVTVFFVRCVQIGLLTYVLTSLVTWYRGGTTMTHDAANKLVVDFRQITVLQIRRFSLSAHAYLDFARNNLETADEAIDLMIRCNGVRKDGHNKEPSFVFEVCYLPALIHFYYLYTLSTFHVEFSRPTWLL